MPFDFIATDITTLAVDAIAIPCSPHPVMSEGLNDDVYHKAGPSLLAARKKIGAIPFGHAAVTSAYQLPAQSLIHVAIPPYQPGAEDTLLSAYLSVFHLAKTHHIHTVTLPLLGSAQGYPDAIARDTLSQALAKSPDTDGLVIRIILPTALLCSGWQHLRQYLTAQLISASHLHASSNPNSLHESNHHTSYQPLSRIEKELAQRLSSRETGFSQTLLSLISQQGKTEPDIYKKANIDRRLFSKIRNNPEYQPTKATALAFAIALELPLTEVNDFLRTAGYTLTHTSKTDIIVEYFILQKNYDMFTINEALFTFGESSLGSI